MKDEIEFIFEEVTVKDKILWMGKEKESGIELFALYDDPQPFESNVTALGYATINDKDNLITKNGVFAHKDDIIRTGRIHYVIVSAKRFVEVIKAGMDELVRKLGLANLDDIND